MKSWRDRWFVEVKLGISRLSGYAGVATMMLVLALWYDKAYDALQPMNIGYYPFMGVAFTVTILAAVMAVIIDRRLVWPREGSISAGVVPIARSEALRSAYFLAKHGDKEAVKRARPWFEEAGLGEEFDYWFDHWRAKQESAGEVTSPEIIGQENVKT